MTPEKSSAAGALAAIVVVMVLAWLALRPVSLAAPAGPDAPAGVFSAARALPHLHALAQAPRPIASPANARAREYILERLRAMGLAPYVHSATVQGERASGGTNHVTLARVHNILMRKPGRGGEGRPALLLASHYDSAPDTLGAAGAGASVAAMLEALRALQTGAPLENDLIVLIADAGEAGALGARAFVEQHPWAGDVGLSLSFDGAGRSGPLVLLEAHGGNGNTVAAWARAVPGAVGSSHLHEAQLAARLGDSAPLRRLGKPGMTFANIEAGAGASGMLDTPARFDPRTLQHSGDTMLALAREFGDLPLRRIAAPDRVYFNVPGLGVVHYAAAQVGTLTRLVCLMFIVVAWAVVWRRAMSVRQLAFGALAFVLMVAIAATAAYLLWRCFPGMHPNYRPRLVGAGQHDHWYLLAAATLTSAIFIALQRPLQAAIGLPAAKLGALMVMVVMLVGASWATPGAAYLLAWPLIGALLAFGALNAPGVAALPQRHRIAILLAGLAPAVLLIAPVVNQLFSLLTPEHMDLPMVALALLLGLGTALLAATHRRFLAPALVAASAGCMTVASAHAPYEGTIARANHLTYLKDASSWKSYWLLPDARLDDYSRRFFPAAQRKRALPEVTGIAGQLWVADAPRSGVALPYVRLLKNDKREDVREIAFLLRSMNAAPTVQVRVADAPLLSASLNGKPLPVNHAGHWTLTLHGMADLPLDFRMTLLPDTTARVYIMEKIPGLPAGPRAASGPRPLHTPLTEKTLATDMLVFK